MPYVREKLQRPTAADRARERRKNPSRFAPDPANPGARFYDAFEWLRMAAIYAGRRSYRTLDIAERAVARRDRIRGDAARVVQATADEVAALIPSSFRPGRRREQIRGASALADTPKAQLDLARAWLMHADALAGRYARQDGGAARARAAVIKGEATARLIEWAEEMDADDYGE